MPSLIQKVTEDYALVKRILNKARHPAFIGRESFGRWASNGGALVWFLDGEPVAASLVNTKTSVLMALSVVLEFQGQGIGQRIIEYIKPNWARVLESKTKWFERLGYVCVGTLKQGQPLRTQIMVRSDLKTLGKRVAILKNS